MKVTETNIQGLKILEPKVFEDSRGSFFESFNARDFTSTVDINCEFVQDNQSSSNKGVVRGLHYQLKQPQDKLVRVISGEIFDVAVDIRKDSKSFGQWFGIYLSAENKKQLWVPRGFAHGFMALKDDTEVAYKISDYYLPGDEYSIIWDDDEIGIHWPEIAVTPVLSLKDREACSFNNAILA